MSNENTGWAAFDFDGTLATYDRWQGPSHCGEPVSAMVELVKKMLKDGREVRIFTARCFPLGLVKPSDLLMHHYDARRQEANSAVAAIREWCAKHLGRVLAVTCIKDFSMDVLYDDRAIQVRKNTGEIVGE